MKKRASQFLPENVVSILIGAIILVGFGLGIYTWYQTARTNTEFSSAVSTIMAIKGKIDALEIGQENNFPFQGFAGKQNWYVRGYSNKTINRPEKCFFESCICISPSPTPESCDNEGKTESINAQNIVVEGPRVKEVCFFDRRFFLAAPNNCYQPDRREDYIIIPENLYLLHISKQKINNEIIVTVEFNPKNEQ